ncbi:MAG TPA: FAD-dependent oxidoreductase [Sphingomicrobium sp.]|nr:FAD-dependent oxidoreductase [Sphingomicrobium sp.]
MTGWNVTRRSLLIGAGGVALSAPAVLRADVRIADNSVVVVGAGVFGAWTAHHLKKLGYSVTLVDAWGPAHSRASSGGESRLTRAAYGKDEIYTRMARDSLPQWKELSALSGLPILIPNGILFFFPTEEPYVQDSIAAHKKLGLPTEMLSQTEMAKRFPMIDFSGISVGLYEPGFGALMARRAVQTLVRQLERGGKHQIPVDYRTAQVVPKRLTGDRLESLATSDGGSIGGARFVFALGPWLSKFFPDVIGPRILPTRQEVFYFAAPPGDERFQPLRMPGWADFNGGDIFYGLPDLEGRGVKFAHDQHGVEVDPDTQDRRPTKAALDEIIAYRDRRFPALKGAQLTGAEVCQYENSSNGDFLIDFHPRLKNLLLVGGGSGHGFKHGPEVGRYAAGLLDGSVTPEPRFSLATKSESHKREVH